MQKKYFRHIPRHFQVALIHIGVILLGAASAYAGSISLVSSSEFQTTLNEQSLSLKGTYKLSNDGDETARDVFPTLRLGNWGWSGNPRMLKKSAEEIWHIEADIPLIDVTCENRSNCVASPSPLRGVFPLLVRHHYSDLNGYKFTAPSLVALQMGTLSPLESVMVHEPELTARFEITGNGQQFYAKLTVQNLSQRQRQVSVSAFSSQELMLLDDPRKLDLASMDSKEVSLKIQNSSATLGSSYPVFALITWNDEGLQNLVTSAAVVKINPQQRSYAIWIGAIAALLLLFSLRFWSARRSKVRDLSS